ncbi:hypothetical protein G9A89_004259 [Geosiphon pyriformis]|nr:hypothetical protein G9A89_004259 [Geosiphon pyriformis]
MSFAKGPPFIFTIPTKKILTKEDLQRFQESSAYNEYLGFIERLNSSVQGLMLSSDCVISQPVENIIAILDTVNSYCQEIPPVQNEKSRFGNPAFKDFYDRVQDTVTQLYESLPLPLSAIPELSRYFVESWGNRTRIDYGTGHEANFVAWLLCLEKLGLIGPDDYQGIVLRVFQKYLEVMRNLQFQYWLEPAGSHGVWGLDDYHFLPFLFGSAQLMSMELRDPMIVKTASLEWNSPMLNDISGVKTWKKVNEGMIKMYKAEVLGKLPIMQHFMFGSLISFEGSITSDGLDEDEHDHAHIHAFGEEFPDCCGIKIPSAIGATLIMTRLTDSNLYASNPSKMDHQRKFIHPAPNPISVDGFSLWDLYRKLYFAEMKKVVQKEIHHNNIHSI